jgi:BirA family biotin operon repressor/biotin-[acetyl-CoA-carboxylase] ligase
VNWRIERFKSLPSTNEAAVRRIREGIARDGDVIVAGTQTAGRGRRGRRWHDGPGALLFTVVLAAPEQHREWSALAGAVAVAEGLRRYGAAARVKWPNDIILDGLKVAGVLAEIPAAPLAAIGIGVNINNKVSTGEVDRPATSLRQNMGRACDVEAVLAELLESLQSIWPIAVAGRTDELLRRWRILDATPGMRLRLSDGTPGTALHLDRSGDLCVLTDKGERRLARIDGAAFLEEE